MTTSIIVTACCSPDKEVHVTTSGNFQPSTNVLQNGQSLTFFAYDERLISVKEVSK